MMKRLAGWHEDTVTIVGGVWLTVGLFLDGYAHENILTGDSESFFTLWHAVVYAGFAVTAAWLVHLRRRGPLDDAYRLAIVGILLFGVGGAGDLAWHTALGVETGIDALLSPTHLVLFVGLVLILTTALRHRPDSTAAVVSVGLATALAGLFTSWAWGFGIAELTEVRYDPVTKAGEAELIAGLASIALTTAILCGAALALALARRPRPFGTHAVLFTVTALLVTAGFDEGWQGIPAALVGGLAIDVLTGRVPRLATLPASMLVMWATYLALVRVGVDDNGWPVETWTGAPVMAALVAAGLQWLVAARRSTGQAPPERSARQPVMTRAVTPAR